MGRVWFHVFEENSMKRLKALAHWVFCRNGIIVGATAMLLALSSSSASRVGATVLAALAGAPSPTPVAAEQNVTGIKPFRINVPQADIVDLRRRLRETRWPEKETVADPSQGPQLAQLQELVR